MSASPTQITFDTQQLEAIKLACDAEQRIVGVTGAAGTGKTVILREVYDNFTRAGYTVALAAPTGKAAKRIRDVTGLPAQTIHRLLEYTTPRDYKDEATGKVYEWSTPRRHSRNPLEQKVLLLDEYSMVNRELHANIMAAIPPGGIVRAFGDTNQLPPIEDRKYEGANSPFTVLLRKFNSVTLQTIHRQGEGSGIIKASQQILAGRVPQNNDEFVVEITDTPVGALTKLVDETGKKFIGLDYQVLTPMNKSKVGTKALNTLMQGLLFPDKRAFFALPRFDIKEEKLRVGVGDKIIITTNNETLGIFNGETGIVVGWDASLDLLEVDMGDRHVFIPPVLQLTFGSEVREIHPQKSIELAYVITTHKAQGSEYKHVVYVLNRATGYMQNRRNFYTAVTRGREKVTVITDRTSLSNSVFKKGD